MFLNFISSFAFEILKNFAFNHRPKGYELCLCGSKRLAKLQLAKKNRISLGVKEEASLLNQGNSRNLFSRRAESSSF